MQFYLPIMVACFITFKKGKLSTSFSKFSYAMAFLSFFGMIALFGFSLSFFSKETRYKMQNRLFKRKFGSLFEDKDLDILSLSYQVVFFLHRILFALVLVYLDHEPLA